MASASITAAGKANRGAEARFTRLGSPLHGVARLARIIWPDKTAAEMAFRTMTSERACREILAERAILSTGALIRILQSEEGYEFLRLIMGNHKPTWWRWAKRAVHLGKMRRTIERQRKAMEQYELDLAEEFSGFDEDLSPRSTRRA